MVFAVKSGKSISKEKINKVFEDDVIKWDSSLFSPDGSDSGVEDDSLNLLCAGFEDAVIESQDSIKYRATYKTPKLLSELSIGAPIDGLESLKKAAFTTRGVGPKPFASKFEKDIEEIVKERWGYLVMQFGGVFLTEVRPDRCFIGNKKLADDLILYDKKQNKYGLNFQLLGNYLKHNSKGFVQIHLSDIIFNPKINDYDIFSVTSGDKNKAEIFFDLSKFLNDYNKGKESVIPVHLPYFEKWKTSEVVTEFGELSENGKRDAVTRAEKVLRYLSDKIEKSKFKIKLALETGGGESRRNGQINYALIYDPIYLEFLTRKRNNITICEDVGHLNLNEVRGVDWKDYLAEEISEFHVSGNNGREDQHTIASVNTLKNYHEIMSFLKFYSGNICAEIGKGYLSTGEFTKAVKDLAYTLFSEPNKMDFENLKKIERYVKITNGENILEKNLNQDRYEKYEQYINQKA